MKIKTLIIVIQLISIVSLPLTVFSQKISEKDTSLLGAVKRDDLQLVKNLVSKGANVNFQDENGASVLMWAAFNDDLLMVKYLVGKGAVLNKKGPIDDGSFIFDNVLSIAVRNKNADLVFFILNKCKCSITNNDIVPIDKTGNEKHFSLNDFDIENPDDGYILSYLFSSGLDISIFDLINFEDTEWAVKDFLKNYPDSLEITDSLSRTLLHAASLNNRLTLAEYLLKEGAELDAIDVLGYTPYYLAKVEGNTEIMDLLSDDGADTTIIPFDVEKPGKQEETQIIEEDFESRIHRPLKPELVLPYGHTDRINTVNYSNNGRLIITGSNDNTAKVWEASTGKLLYSLEKHTAWVQYAAFSPDMEFIVTQTLANKTYIWYTKTGELIHTFNCDARIHPFFSSDSKNIFVPFSLSFGKYDVMTGKLLSIFKGHSDVINSLSVNNEETSILTASNDGTIKIWDAASDKLLYTLTGTNSKVELAKFSNDSKFILSVSENNVVNVWSTDTGNLLYTFDAQKAKITNISFSPDDNYILTESLDDSVKVWSTSNGKMLYSIFHYKLYSNAGIIFSEDNKYIYTKSDEKGFSIRDISTGKLLHSSDMNLIDVLYVPTENKLVLFSDDSIHTIETSLWKTLNKVKTESSITGFSKRLISPDKQFLLQSYNHNKVYGLQIFNINSGKLTSEMFRHAYKIISADFNTSNDSLIIVTERGITIDSHNSHKMFQILSGYKNKSYLSPNKKIISISGNMASFQAFEISTGKNTINQWFGREITSVSYDPSGDKMAISEINGVVYILECGTGKLLSELKLPGKISCLSFSSDGKFLGIATFTGEIKLFRNPDFSEYKTLTGHRAGINSIEFSHNGKLCVTSSNDSTAKVWDIQKGELISTLKTEGHWVSTALFSPDDKLIITATSSSSREILSSGNYSTATTFGGNESWGRIKIWDSLTGNLISNLDGHTGGIEDIIFSSDGKYLLTGSSDNSAIIWDCATRKSLFKFEGHTSGINSVRFSSDGKYVLTASNDSRVKIWDSSTGKEILSYISIDSTDWVVLSPTGLFDASAGAMKQMYYVQGLDIIELDQLKDRYYEPNLWSKLMGINTESLRDVKGLDEIKLFPSISLKITDDNLIYTLTDRGGGIGKYMIYINGKETLTANLPEDNINFRGGKTISSTFSLKNHPYLIPVYENEIMMKAFNAENYLVSRGEKVIYIPKGEIVSQKPKLFLITSGVSDYTGDQIDLKYASKDAEDMAKALELGANRLFGTESTFTFKLTSDNPDLKSRPTKANIIDAFNNVAKQAKASDILIVYISGHGINLGGQDGDFYYLTQDAYTSNINAYNDKVIRDKTTISSSEMTELIKKVPALKQVLIIDACGSGKAVENLIEKRDVSSSTLRALDRMKDRTGLHIITGCAADAVSYEASKFGQGVLTYSLLEGVLGASLRENRFIDVVKLFQYGRERVPELAKGFGGIQQPQIFSPYGESSFDIGEIETEDKSMINLAQAKFIVLMSSIKDKETFDDILGIEKIIDDKLREKSSGDLNSPFVFVDAKDFPDAYKIRGQYSVSGNDVEVIINFFKGTIKKSSFVIKGVKTDLNNLSDLIIKKLLF